MPAIGGSLLRTLIVSCSLSGMFQAADFLAESGLF
jgi:hypothetical protein